MRFLFTHTQTQHTLHIAHALCMPEMHICSKLQCKRFGCMYRVCTVHILCPLQMRFRVSCCGIVKAGTMPDNLILIFSVQCPENRSPFIWAQHKQEHTTYERARMHRAAMQSNAWRCENSHWQGLGVKAEGWWWERHAWHCIPPAPSAR